MDYSTPQPVPYLQNCLWWYIIALICGNRQHDIREHVQYCNRWKLKYNVFSTVPLRTKIMPVTTTDPPPVGYNKNWRSWFLISTHALVFTQANGYHAAVSTDSYIYKKSSGWFFSWRLNIYSDRKWSCFILSIVKIVLHKFLHGMYGCAYIDLDACYLITVCCTVLRADTYN